MSQTITVNFGGSPIQVEVGENTGAAAASATAAQGFRDEAQLSAATAEAAAGPNYADTTAGLAATSDGQAFAVDNGDGTVTVYLNDAGVAVAQRTLATTDALAASDGSSLVGHIQSGTGAVARTVQARLRERISVTDFGVTGDGTTDDTANIQAAIDAVIAAGGGDLVFPPGDYLVSITSGYALRIAGSNIRLYLQNGCAIKLANSQLSGTATGDIIQIGDGNTVFKDISIIGPGLIDGNLANQTKDRTLTTSRQAVRIHGPVEDVRISGMRIRDHVGGAVLVDGTATQTALRIQINHNHVENVGEGILWTRSEHVAVDDNIIKNVFLAQDAIEPYGVTAKYWSITNNKIETVGGSAIDCFAGPSFGLIEGNIIVNASADTGEVNTGGTPSLFINGNASGTRCSNIQCVNNQIDGTNQIGIQLDGFCDAMTVEGNRIRETSGASIFVDAGSLDIKVIGNDVKPAAGAVTTGIRVDASDCIVAKNICNDGPGNGIQIGVVATNPVGVQVEGNQASGNVGYGIACYGERCLVSGNLTKNNNPGNFANGAGIFHSTGSDSAFEGNYCYDDQGTPTQDWGLYIASGSRNVLKGNVTRGNQNGHILDTATDTIRKDNTAPDDYRKAKTDLATTFDVEGVEVLEFVDTGATTVTGFTGGHKGQEVRLEFSNANTTLQHSASLKIPGGANKATDANDTLLLVMETATSGRIVGAP